MEELNELLFISLNIFRIFCKFYILCIIGLLLLGSWCSFDFIEEESPVRELSIIEDRMEDALAMNVGESDGWIELENIVYPGDIDCKTYFVFSTIAGEVFPKKDGKWYMFTGQEDPANPDSCIFVLTKMKFNFGVVGFDTVWVRQ